METKKKKNRIILCICSFLVLFASIFATIPFNNDTKVVNADTVVSDYSYSGSNFTSNTTFTNGNFTSNIFPLRSTGTYIVNSSSNYRISITDDFYILSSSNATQNNHGFNLLSSFVKLYSGVSYTMSILDVSGSYTGNVTIASQAVRVSDNQQFNNFFNIAISNGATSTTITPTFDCYLDRVDLYSASGAIFNDFSFRIMLETSSTPSSIYVPYSNTTSVNYKFDFRILNAIPTNAIELQYNLGYSITDNYGFNYAISPTENGSSIIDINDTSYLPYVWLPTCGLRYCYRYNNGVFDYNYYIPLYYAFDYIVSYTNDVPFNGNVSYIVFGSYLDSASYFHPDSYTFYQDSIRDFIINGKYNFIGYVDTNGNTFNIIIPLDTSISSSYFNFRKYFLQSDNVSSSYYNDGYRVGFSNGEDKGYSDGYLTGKNDGYNLGYNTALENDDRYNFTNLIASVIDVPVQTFTSLFNFEILGVNLSGFFLGLLTCCIVIGVVRLIL